MPDELPGSGGGALADPCRLRIVLELAGVHGGWIEFGALRRRLGLSDGNLLCHVRRLLAAALVQMRGNGARGRASRTEFRLSDAGRSQLAARAAAHAGIARRIEETLRAVPRADSSPAMPSDRGAPVAFIAPAAVTAVAARAAVVELVDERFSGPD